MLPDRLQRRWDRGPHPTPARQGKAEQLPTMTTTGESRPSLRPRPRLTLRIVLAMVLIIPVVLVSGIATLVTLKSHWENGCDRPGVIPNNARGFTTAHSVGLGTWECTYDIPARALEPGQDRRGTAQYEDWEPLHWGLVWLAFSAAWTAMVTWLLIGWPLRKYRRSARRE